MLLSVTEQEQEINCVSPPFKEVDTGSPLLLSTIYFWKFVQIFINVLFIPQHFGKNLFRWYRKTIDRDTASPLLEYKELLKQTTALDLEKFQDIALTVSFEPDTLTVSFESGRVTFYKRNLDVVTNLIDMLSGVDIKHFGRCEYCGKCIVLKRGDKRYCPDCAAKKFQKDKWQQDPKGMREKERVRYREKRKKS